MYTTGNDNELDETECEMCASEKPGSEEKDSSNITESELTTITENELSLYEMEMSTDPVVFDIERGVVWRLPNRISGSNNATFLIQGKIYFTSKIEKIKRKSTLVVF